MNRRGMAVVVGGGIGGLAAAIGLHRIGWKVTVLERLPVLDDAGAGISLQANGLRALDALGVGDSVRGAGAEQGSGGIRTPSGRWLARMDMARAGARLGSAVYSFHRARLHETLRGHLPVGQLVTGAQVTGVRDGEEGAVVEYEGDSGVQTVRADLVVGADGVHSRTRRAVCPDAPGPEFTGTTVWRAVTDWPVAGQADIDQTWGPGLEFGSTRLPGGFVEWHALTEEPLAVPAGNLMDEVRPRFGHWHDPIPALLDATAPGTVLRHDVFALDTPLPTFVSGRLVLLGDAAHAMTPHLGQGASQALEDAVVLAAALHSAANTASALAHYDTVRRPRAQAVAKAARRTGRVGHRVRTPLALALRNTLIRATPAGLALGQMVKHAAWTPPSLPTRTEQATRRTYT
ncbi:FAD-dependent monooxygenase [Nonomuraea endophytica]|uniref:FAD-dependent monooxygenase n=1 Tax=Nonomuraea endophytica TaxID=714136 RepID=UPI0037C56D0F